MNEETNRLQRPGHGEGGREEEGEELTLVRRGTEGRARGTLRRGRIAS
jgi:hypothetical protein